MTENEIVKRCECESCKRSRKAWSLMERLSVEDALFISELVDALDALELDLEFEQKRNRDRKVFVDARKYGLRALWHADAGKIDEGVDSEH